VANNQTVCSSTSTLGAIAPLTGSGVWTSTATITSAISASTTVSNLAVGINQFTWTVTNGSCPSSTAALSIQRDDNPTVSNAGTNQTVCATNATVTANIPSTGTGSWSVISGGSSLVSSSSFSSAITNLAVGSNQLMWSISNGVCPVSTSTLNIQRDALPSTAITAANQTVCSATSTLGAIVPLIGNGVWTSTATITSVNSPSTTTSNLMVGINQFTWTVSNASCPSSTAALSIQRDDNPGISNAGTSQTICAPSATLSATIPTVGTGAWSVLTGGSSVVSVSSNSSVVNSLSVGVNQLVWTVSNGVCPASSSTVNIQRDALPSTASVAANQKVCSTSSSMAAVSPVV
jgi:hypothetical protein